MVFEEKSDNYAIYSKYRGVYALLISFLKQSKKFFFHLIEHALRSLLVLKYLWLILGKSTITAGDTLNSRSSIYVPKNVLVKKDLIYIKKLFTGKTYSPGRSAQDLNIFSGF